MKNVALKKEVNRALNAYNSNKKPCILEPGILKKSVQTKKNSTLIFLIP